MSRDVLQPTQKEFAFTCLSYELSIINLSHGWVWSLIFFFFFSLARWFLILCDSTIKIKPNTKFLSLNSGYC